MEEVLTVAEIERRYPDEWILLEDPELDEHLNVLRGRVLAHSKDRDEVGRVGVQRRPPSSAYVYTGRIPDDARLIVVNAELTGPTGSTRARVALDTGATCTMLRLDLIASIGYDPSASRERFPFVTGSAMQAAPRLRLDRLLALGQERRGMLVVCHTLPSAAMVDGLLGLDFFRDRELCLDFRAGALTLR